MTNPQQWITMWENNRGKKWETLSDVMRGDAKKEKPTTENHRKVSFKG